MEAENVPSSLEGNVRYSRRQSQADRFQLDMTESLKNGKSGAHNGTENHLLDPVEVQVVTGDLRNTKYRFLVLIFICFLSFGAYFCYDVPGALQQQFLTDLNINTYEFSLMYSLYSWPNVILCFFSGYLLDRVFGVRYGTILFATITLLGQVLSSLGAIVNAFWLIQIGRFVLGVGGESLTVADNAYTARWFKGKELNMVFGMQLSCARLGATVNFVTMVSVYNQVGRTYGGHVCLGITLFIATFSCLVSQMNAVFLCMLDKRAEKTFDNSTEPSGQVFRIWDIKHFPLNYWLIVIVSLLFYVCIYPFIALATLVYIISAACCPVCGFVMDRVSGSNATFVLIGQLITLLSHFLLLTTYLDPWIPMALLGVGFSLLACGLWPMVALVIPTHQTGTAYGILISALNSGLAVSSALAGMIVDTYGYLMVELLFLVCVALSLLATTVLILLNNRNENEKREALRTQLKQQLNGTITENQESTTFL